MCNFGSKHSWRLKLNILDYFNQTKRNLKKKIGSPPPKKKNIFKTISPNLVFTSKANPKLNTIAHTGCLHLYLSCMLMDPLKFHFSSYCFSHFAHLKTHGWPRVSSSYSGFYFFELIRGFSLFESTSFSLDCVLSCEFLVFQLFIRLIKTK